MSGNMKEEGSISPEPRHKEDVTYLLLLRFQDLMRDGLLTPGSMLPSERELAANFGVARSSLRQAMKVLETMGVVTQKVGDGTYLNKDGASVLSVPIEFLFLLDDTSIRELMELRLMLEPALAAKAAERATVEDIALLKQSMQNLQASGNSRAQLVAADLMFHRTIFRATGNRLAGRLFHTIHSAMSKMIVVTSQVVEVEHTIRFHQPILEAIEQRDSKGAASLMTDHLIDARDLILHNQKKAESLILRKHLLEGRNNYGTISRQATASGRKNRREMSLVRSSAG